MLMSDLNSEIDAALVDDNPIPRERFLVWIDAATSLPSLSKLYRLTEVDYYRIQPDLGQEVTCALILRYLLQCIRENVQDDDAIQSRFEAAGSLHQWFCHLVKRDDSSVILNGVVHSITELFLVSDEKIQNAIETGFLEHVLETAALRPYFEYWATDERLSAAWDRALEWGKAHPDFTLGLLEQLRQIQAE